MALTPDHAHAALLKTFYEAFQKLDAETMAGCYHPDIAFSDPVFPDLKGRDAGDMWRMLCGRAKDLKVEVSGIKADDQEGVAHWEAHYTFSQTGRKVHNIIDAKFRFKDGQIIAHTDSFNLYRWSRQALGPTGLLLGWTPIVQNKVRAMAAKGLKLYQDKNSESK